MSKPTQSADKRSVSTDALETLGTIITDTEKRDAIHLAVLPARAAHRLQRGQHVALQSNGIDAVACVDAADALGIVDPFIPRPVEPGEHFWFVVLPRKITSLRHVWSHPQIDSPPVEDSESRDRFLRAGAVMVEEAEAAGLSLKEFMQGADMYLAHGHYLNDGGRWEGHSVRTDFWEHYAIYTGSNVDTDRGNFFSCSC